MKNIGLLGIAGLVFAMAVTASAQRQGVGAHSYSRGSSGFSRSGGGSSRGVGGRGVFSQGGHARGGHYVGGSYGGFALDVNAGPPVIVGGYGAYGYVPHDEDYYDAPAVGYYNDGDYPAYGGGVSISIGGGYVGGGFYGRGGNGRGGYVHGSNSGGQRSFGRGGGGSVSRGGGGHRF